MAIEVERKFLVAGDAWRDGAELGARIRQFYLVADSDRSLRVRIKNDNAAQITFKAGGQRRERQEFEYPVPVDDAREMRKLALGNIVEKTRWLVGHAGHVFEIDVFEGDLAGLVVAELEGDDTADAVLPEWIAREITDDARYYNASLALKGVPGGP